MENINLLGSDISKKGNIVDVSSKLKIGLAVVFVVLIVVTTLSGVIMFINNNRLNSSLASQKQYRTSIEQLNTVEQSYFLTKDRAVRVIEVLSSGDAEDDIDYFKDFTDSKREDVEFDTLSIRKSGADFDATMGSIASMFSFLDLISKQQFYQNARLSDLSFSPTAGYSVSLEVSR